MLARLRVHAVVTHGEWEVVCAVQGGVCARTLWAGRWCSLGVVFRVSGCRPPSISPLIPSTPVLSFRRPILSRAYMYVCLPSVLGPFRPRRKLVKQIRGSRTRCQKTMFVLLTGTVRTATHLARALGHSMLSLSRSYQSVSKYQARLPSKLGNPKAPLFTSPVHTVDLETSPRNPSGPSCVVQPSRKGARKSVSGSKGGATQELSVSEKETVSVRSQQGCAASVP